MIFIDWLKALYECDMRALAGFIWLGMIVLGIIFTAVSGGNVKVAKWSIVSIASFYILAKLICGPSLIDTYRMKPMAEAISNYIVKNGIPKSLKDIPDLPYELEGCKDVDDEKICHYKKSFAYIVRIYTPITNELAVEIFNQNSKTGIQYWFEVKNTKIILERKGNAYSSKTSGICNPMRQ